MNNQNSGVAEGGNALKQLYCTPYAACCITHTYVSSRGGNGGAKWQRADSSAALCLLKCNFCYLYLSFLQLIKSTTAVSYINTYRVLYQRTHTTHSPTGKMWVRRAHSFRLCFRRRLLLVSSKQKLNVAWKILRYARKASVTVAKVAAAAARVLRAQRVAQQLACYSIKISALLWRHMQFKQEIQSDCSGQPTLKRVSQQTGGTGWTALATYRQEVPIFVDYAGSTAAQWICLLSFVHRALHPHTHLLIHSFIHRLFRLLLCSSIRAKVSFMCISQLTFRHFWSYRHRLSALPLPGFCGKFTIALPCLLHAGFAYNANLPLLSSK